MKHTSAIKEVSELGNEEEKQHYSVYLGTSSFMCLTPSFSQLGVYLAQREIWENLGAPNFRLLLHRSHPPPHIKQMN